MTEETKQEQLALEREKEIVAESDRKWPEGTRIYSYSRLRDQASCPARNYFRQLVKEGKAKEDLRIPALAGAAIHKGIEERLKFERHPLVVAKNFLDQSLEESGNQQYIGGEDYTSTMDHMTKCVSAFEEHFYPSLKETITDPEHQVEVQVETPFRQGIMVGRIDLIIPQVCFTDFKTGKVVPSDFDLLMEPQHGFYFYLGRKVGMELPNQFVYVYLKGKNLAYHTTKNGNVVVDRKNPQIRYSFPVQPTKESVDSLLNNFIIPVAKLYEEGVLYKNPSSYNCGQCFYRSTCIQTDLPSIGDTDIPILLEKEQNGK